MDNKYTVYVAIGKDVTKQFSYPTAEAVIGLIDKMLRGTDVLELTIYKHEEKEGK